MQCWPNRLDAYEIGKLLGSSHADVREAFCKNMKYGQCAMKRIDHEKHPKAAKREINACDYFISKQMKDENVIQYFTQFKEGRFTYICMEKMDCTLCDVMIKRDVPLNLTVTMLRDTLRGISYLHSKGAMHRDVKPANILVRFADGSIKLADFDSFGTMDAIRRTFVGTLNYTAPELLTTGEDEGYDNKVDIWSYAMVVYALFSNEEPYNSQSESAIYENITTGIPPILENAYARFVSAGGTKGYLTSLFSVCLDKNPRNRPCADVLLTYDFFKSSIDDKKVFAEGIRTLMGVHR